MASAKWPTAAPLRMSNNLHCGYWSAASPCISSTQAGGPPRQKKQRSSAPLAREKNTQDPLRNPVASVAGGAKCSKDLGPLVARGAGWPECSKGWNSRCHCRAASAAVLAAVAEAGAGALRRCAATVAAVARRLCCCGARAVSSGQQSLDGTEHHGPRAASPGVEESGQLRHRHPHTSPDGKRRRGCLERRRSEEHTSELQSLRHLV